MTNRAERACVDCTHYRNASHWYGSAAHSCARAAPRYLDRVAGRMREDLRNAPLCEDERRVRSMGYWAAMFARLFPRDRCGPVGKYFTPRPKDISPGSWR